MATRPLFLSLADVIVIHVDQIERYGGQAGIRDWGLLHSALLMPQASFGQEWMHRDLYEMAAAYAFHISQDQPFYVGNKRTALTCTLVFLELNGVSLPETSDRLYQAMMDVANGVMDKLGLASFLRSLT